MEYNLTIDRGNSTVKLAAWAPDNTCIATERGDEINHVATLAARLAARLGMSVPKFAAAAYCTVVPSWRKDDLAELGDISPKVIDVTSSVPLPFRLGYPTLGADRIAAIAGALALRTRPCALIVADIGTAATYEFINAEGEFVGGNIAPGIGMRFDALHRHTALLPMVESSGATPLWGYSTDTALRSGVLRGLAAELEYYHNHGPEGNEIFITGGSAALLVEDGLITFPHKYDPLLVHRGLNSIIHHNENH